jgi:hypothetical protein
MWYEAMSEFGTLLAGLAAFLATSDALFKKSRIFHTHEFQSWGRIAESTTYERFLSDGLGRKEVK